MGVPLASVMTKMFMAHLETIMMDELRSIGLCEWHRYIDSTAVLVLPGTHIPDILNLLCSFHPSIKFTYEVETNDSLPFRDMRVIHPPLPSHSHLQWLRQETHILRDPIHRMYNSVDEATVHTTVFTITL